MNLPPLLASYYYLGNRFRGQLELVASLGAEIMLDSGAFSAHRQGGTVDLDAYSEFVVEWTERFPSLWGCVQLDVMGDHVATLTNLDYMVKRGAKPMPVLTVDMPLSNVPHLVEVNPRICIAGGLGQFSGAFAWAMRRYSHVHAMAAEAQIHALGFVRWPDLFQCGLASADSSSVTQGQRNGCVASFRPLEGPRLSSQPRKGKPDRLRDKLLSAGVTPGLAADPANWHGAFSIPSITTAHAFIQAALFARRRYGFRIFLAINSYTEIELIVGIMCSSPGRLDYRTTRNALAEFRTLKGAARRELLAKRIHELAA